MPDANLADPPRFSLRARLIGAAALLLIGIAVGIRLEYGVVVAQLSVRCPPVWPALKPVAADPGQAIVPPRVLDHPLAYSWGERLLGMHGDVILNVFVEPDGTVGQARVIRSSGFCPLDATALGGVKSWRYRPAARHGVPFGAWWTTRVAFRSEPPTNSAPPVAGQQSMNTSLRR